MSFSPHNCAQTLYPKDSALHEVHQSCSWTLHLHFLTPSLIVLLLCHLYCKHYHFLQQQYLLLYLLKLEISSLFNLLSLSCPLATPHQDFSLSFRSTYCRWPASSLMTLHFPNIWKVWSLFHHPWQLLFNFPLPQLQELDLTKQSIKVGLVYKLYQDYSHHPESLWNSVKHITHSSSYSCSRSKIIVPDICLFTFFYTAATQISSADLTLVCACVLTRFCCSCAYSHKSIGQHRSTNIAQIKEFHK